MTARVGRCLACDGPSPAATPGLCRSCGWRSGLAEPPGLRQARAGSDFVERAYHLAPYAGRPSSRPRSPLVELLLRFKYHGERRCGYALMAVVRRHTTRLPVAVDAIVPLPLHHKRLTARGFNQAAWIARAVARAGGGRVAADALRRRRDTAPQAGRSRLSRLRAVDGIFLAQPRAVAGRSLLLVDDVSTTGATAHEAARALRSAGATRVYLFCMFATTRGEARR